MEIDTESKASHDAEAVPVTDQPSGDENSKIEKNNTASDSTDTPKETGVKHTDVSDTTDTSNGTGDESRKETNGVSNGNDESEDVDVEENGADNEAEMKAEKKQMELAVEMMNLRMLMS